MISLFLSFFLSVSPLTADHVEHHFLIKETDASCSLASLTVVINAMLGNSGREPLTQQELLRIVDSKAWCEEVAEGGNGTSLHSLALVAKMALKKLCLNGTVNVFFATPAFPDKIILSDLAKARRGEAYLIANFDDKVYQPLFASSTGHFSPVGTVTCIDGYVLILDNEIDFPGPYFVTIPTFIRGMRTLSSDGITYRGYILIQPYL